LLLKAPSTSDLRNNALQACSISIAEAAAAAAAGPDAAVETAG